MFTAEFSLDAGGWALACGALSAAAVFLVRAYAHRKDLLDQPNTRSSHTRPTPRLGGLGLMAAFVGTALVAARSLPSGASTVLVGAVVVSALGLLDDVRPLPARVRFAVQAAAAALVVWLRRDALSSGFLWSVHLPSWILAPVAILWIVWMTNLYNFMDGIDGLAAGQTVFASLGLAAGVMAAGSVDSALLLVLLAAASCGFLLFNFPPASIFMGDVGSTAIGFFLACAPFLPTPRPVPIEAVWIATGLFILDATVTLVRRVRNGERWYEAHRSHWYQRPLKYGVPHRTITLWAYAGMLLLAFASAVFMKAGPAIRLTLLGAPMLVFVPFVVAVRRIERTREPSPAREAA